MTTAERAQHLAQAAARFPLLGPVSKEALLALVAAELGDAEALDRFVPHGAHFSRAVAPPTILHILSGNTPAAALQTLVRGLLLGAHNRCKLPHTGLPEVEEFCALLPAELAGKIECVRVLPLEWLEAADALVVFGSDATIAHFRAQAPPGKPFLAHGHKISLGVVLEDPEFQSVAGAAEDVSIFDQQGCLSAQTIYVRESGACTARAYASRLAGAMAEFSLLNPRGALSTSESLAIRMLREEAAFRAANGEGIAVFSRETDTQWTVIFDTTPGFPRTPLNRVVFVKPLPADFAHELSAVRPHLGTIALQPATVANAEWAAALGAERICAIGAMQRPPLTWHHDGQPVLAPLVKWIDFEPGR
jgi:hypothetical protein